MSDKKIKVNIVLANLTPGGAERVLSFVAQELDKKIFDCTMVIIGQEKDTAYNIQDIDVVYFEKKRVLAGIPRMFAYLNSEKPDIVVSSVAHVNTVMAYMTVFFPKIKFVSREVSVLSVMDTYTRKKFNFFELFAKRRFNFFDKILCLSEEMLIDLQKHHSIKKDKIVVINNPITDGFDIKTRQRNLKELRFITVGRFKKVKGHLRILKVLARLSFPFHYTLIGYGDEKEKMYELIQKHDLGKNISNIHFTDKVSDYLKENDIFLQGSFVEGFPNAITESCAVGVPVLAFKAPGGHNEIIIEGVNGHILDSEDAFVAKLNELYENYYFNTDDVSHSVTSRYGREIILEKYETMLKELAATND